MSSLLATRTARRRGVLFGSLVALSLVLMAVSAHPATQELQRGLSFAFRPVQQGLDEISAGVASVVGAIAEIDRLRYDNAALRSENDRLRAENARLAALRRENEQLTALLQLRTGFEFQTVAARVIARESSEFRRLITIDRGEDHGVKLGDVVVVAGGALAGRIVEVGPGYAQVLLILDPQSTVVGEMVSSGATGEVTGQLIGVLRMSTIDAAESIVPGEEVMTAGLEVGPGIRSPYPRGLVIGQVVDVDRDPNAVVQSAFVTPAVDLMKIDHVLVILDYEGRLPTLEERPIDCTPIDDDDETLPEGEVPCATPSPTPALTPAATATPRP